MSRAEPYKILLVEDNPAHAELVRRGFEDFPSPSAIFHVLDGQEALDYLFRRGRYAERAASPRPHVILLDLRLPRVDGLEVLRQVKSSDSLRSIPVVILTTSTAEHDITEAYDRHTNSYLVKPTGAVGLSPLIQELGHYWLESNEQPSV